MKSILPFVTTLAALLGVAFANANIDTSVAKPEQPAVVELPPSPPAIVYQPEPLNSAMAEDNARLISKIVELEAENEDLRAELARHQRPLQTVAAPVRKQAAVVRSCSGGECQTSTRVGLFGRRRGN
jgi:flagellar basal body-associated protein FliL